MHTAEDDVDEAFTIGMVLQIRRQSTDLGDIGFDTGQVFILRARQGLDEETAGCSNGVILADQDAQADRRRHLFRREQIVSDVFGDFTGHQIGLARIGRLFRRETRHRQLAVLTDTGCHIELAIDLQRQVDLRIVYIAAELIRIEAVCMDGA